MSIRAAVMVCPESKLSAQALPSSLVATQLNTSSEAKTIKTVFNAREGDYDTLVVSRSIKRVDDINAP